MEIPLSEMEKSDFRMEIPLFKTGKTDFRLEIPLFKMENTDFRMEIAHFEMEKPDFHMEIPLFKTEKADFRMEIAFSKTEKAKFRMEIPFSEMEKAKFRRKCAFSENGKPTLRPERSVNGMKKASLRSERVFFEIVKLKLYKKMGNFALIDTMSILKLNKAERLNLLKRFMSLLPSYTPGSGGGDDDDEGASPLLASAEGISKLNISAEQVAQMESVIKQMTEQTMQNTSATDTPEMQQCEANRDVAANYVVRRVVNFNRLPLAAEREAARRLEPIVRPYAAVTSLPAGQETEVIRGLIVDLEKEEHAEDIASLGLKPYIDELERLNELYSRLVAQRDKERSARTGLPVAKTLAVQAQDLLDDMCALANASSLLQPSDEASTFIRETNYLFAQMRTAYKQRSKASVPEDEDTEGDVPADEEA